MYLNRFFVSAFIMSLTWPFICAAENVTVHRQYVDGDFGQIHLRMARPVDTRDETMAPLALFHYSPGSSRMYQNLIPLLAKDRLVMALDTPGYGNSSAPPAQPRISGYAETLATAIAVLTDGRKFDVFGHLTGSFIAAEMAVIYPDMVRRVVLSRSPVFDMEMRERGVAMFQQIHERRQADQSGQYFVDSLETSLANRAPGESPDYAVGTFIDSLLPGNDWIYGEIAAFSYRADLQMPKIAQPTLYLTWTRDYAGAGAAFGGQETWEGGSGIIPNVTVEALSGLGITAWQDQPKIIAESILNFLNSN